MSGEESTEGMTGGARRVVGVGEESARLTGRRETGRGIEGGTGRGDEGDRTKVGVPGIEVRAGVRGLDGVGGKTGKNEDGGNRRLGTASDRKGGTGRGLAREADGRVREVGRETGREAIWRNGVNGVGMIGGLRTCRKEVSGSARHEKVRLGHRQRKDTDQTSRAHLRSGRTCQETMGTGGKVTPSKKIWLKMVRRNVGGTSLEKEWRDDPTDLK